MIALEEEEKDSQAKRETERALAEKNRLYDAAHLNSIDYLFQDMFENDADFKRFLPIAETRINDIVEAYRARFTPVLEEMKTALLKQQELKEQEIKQFEQCVGLAKEERDQSAIKMLNDFNHRKKQHLKRIQNSRESKEVDEAVGSLKKAIDEVSDFLMTQEMQLVEQLEDIIKEFERNYNELCSTTNEIAQAR